MDIGNHYKISFTLLQNIKYCGRLKLTCAAQEPQKCQFFSFIILTVIIFIIIT